MKNTFIGIGFLFFTLGWIGVVLMQSNTLSDKWHFATYRISLTCTALSVFCFVLGWANFILKH